MIHIATVHWQTDKWIDIQLRYLNKYIKEEFRIYTFLSGDATRHKDKYFYACTEPIQDHAIKLNLLTEIIQLSSRNDNDLIIFLDGDAFPVGDVIKLIQKKILDCKLLAIQRIENAGDIQPHPSFCATSIGFWKRIHGDWKSGYRWTDFNNTSITDVGGNLLEILKRNKVEWYALHRSSQLINGHPIWFSIYDHVVYHHGSGFRRGPTKIIMQSSRVQKIQKSFLSILLDKIPDNLVLKIKYKIHPLDRYRRKMYKYFEPSQEKIYMQIKEGNIF